MTRVLNGASPPFDTTYPGLAPGINALNVSDVNGLNMHVLTAGDRDAIRGALVLLHGFPELSFSWRHVMVPLARAGFYVIAPDQRGYGLTTGWDRRFDGDVRSFSAASLVEDIVRLLELTDIDAVAAVIGHDFGSLVAARSALVRPDVFRSAVLMSAPIAPVAPLGAARQFYGSIASGLRALRPPREHYQCYFSSSRAEPDMLFSPAGLAPLLRGYFHAKSGDWRGNDPRPLGDASPEELAKLPEYYVMPADVGMTQTIAPYYDDYAQGDECSWLPDTELSVYAETFARSGFQGGLNWYRCLTEGIGEESLAAFVGKPIVVPVAFIAGERDWGIHQTPGALSAMQTVGCMDFRSLRLVEGAGHWVQQERPGAVIEALLDFVGQSEV